MIDLGEFGIPRRRQRRHMRVADVVTALGGIATTADLLAAEFDRAEIEMAREYRRIRTVRRGWYCVPDTHPMLVMACREGGRLACASALEYHGLLLPGTLAELHIEMPANAVRPVGAGDTPVLVHWTRHPSPGNRAVVDVDAARRQWSRCGA